MKTLLLALVLLAAATPAAAQKNRSAADSTGTYQLRDVTQIPTVLNVDDLRQALNAGYPPALRESRTGGQVDVRFRVDARGVPDAEMFITRSTNPAFDAPTLEALRKLRFSPAKVDDKPVAVWVLLPIEWTASP